MVNGLPLTRHMNTTNALNAEKERHLIRNHITSAPTAEQKWIVILMYDELIKRLRDMATSDGNIKSNYIGLALMEAANAIEDLDNRLNLHRQEKIGHWIPVTERLPEDEVLCINDRQFYLVGLLYCDDVGNYICETVGETMYDVTHWMPLPKPPESDGE